MDNLEINQEQETNKKGLNYSKMSLILSCLSMLFIITIAIIYCIGNCKNKSCNTNVTYKRPAINDSISNVLNIAYVDMAYYLSEYKYAVKLQEDYKTEQKKEEANFESRYNQFLRKAQTFQEKVKLGTFFSQKSMEDQHEELTQEEQNLMKLKEDLQMKFMEKGASIQEELFDTILNFVKEYNYDGRYSLILNSSMVLYGDSISMNITGDIVNQLNERYSKK